MLGRWGRRGRTAGVQRVQARRSRLRNAGLLASMIGGLLLLSGCVADPPPLMGLAIGGNGKATVSWQAPLGIPYPITAYVVTPWIGSARQTPVVFNPTATSEIVSGLTNGTTYTFTVKAINTLGNDSASSAQSNPVTPTGIPIATAIAAGGSHTCALVPDAPVKCWGNNNVGQLGISTNNNSSMPVTISNSLSLEPATAVAAGGAHTCVLHTGISGTVTCWGSNQYGQLGDGTTVNRSAQVVVMGIHTAAAIATGANHSCALLIGGTVKCWGRNNHGELGNNTVTNSSTPVPVTGITTATAISAGEDDTCAVLASGSVDCWGYNGTAELGDGTQVDEHTPVPVTEISTAAAVAVGEYHTCALLSSGTVECWGDNTFGEIGDGIANGGSIHFTPAAAIGITTATAIAAGSMHTCARLADGTVECWGDGFLGELGNGDATANQFSPVAVIGITTATAISAGGVLNNYDQSCALLTDGSVKCWGDNTYGQLGIGNPAIGLSSTPVTVAWQPAAIAVTAGQIHTCAVLAGRTAKCWGDNGNGGELGNGGSTDYSTTPVPVTSLTTATAIAAGRAHSCALLISGSIDCWGYNLDGELGNGTTTNSTTPVPVTGITNATTVTSGGGHTCALLTAGTIKCWGQNLYGELGNGTTTNSTTPLSVTGIGGGGESTASAIAAGDETTCALLTSGTIDCWGLNAWGQLGNGTTTNSATPVAVVGITTATAVTLGSGHACALLTDGAIDCWGYNSWGQLGNGTTTNSTTPLPVTGITTATAINANGQQTCALLTAGSIDCWGYNFHGELGNGTTTNSATPVAVVGITTATAVTLGSGHACALLTDGTIDCWGDNTEGKLGNGTTTSWDAPVEVIWP
jgi:alpha-tubulin suppressor-like RCC1 family protein